MSQSRKNHQGLGTAKVFVVDDDPAVRDSLGWLVSSTGREVEGFASGEAFLASLSETARGCVILDFRMDGMSGLEVLEALRARSILLPVIFLTGHGDIKLAVRAMKAGAFDFLEKPFNDQLLLDLVDQAMGLDADHFQSTSDLDARRASLTERECQVLDGIIEGQSNKLMAGYLGVHAKTIEFHRANLMKKMGAASLAELIKMVFAPE